ncbi:MAG: tRNA pseudouridine(55) synthase TruB, partial [Clostridia bacterium]|nr:tRNA pseudouridine(55) synthase TruB [Clostridia bacterium]
INIYKPVGMTSHDVVNKVRRIVGTKKVGHTGTLDPDAEGVLPICINRGTKVADMLTVSDKRYTATFMLGVTTDTLDISGNVLKECAVNVTEKQLIEAIKSFEGKIQQIPPMYSAIKIGGRKLCDLARKGIEVERKARNVEIYEINILGVKGNYFTIDVKCSKGTYIRTLGSDIGEKLGCGAVMTKLIRTQSSIFEIKNSVKLEDLTPENYSEYVISPDELFDCEKIIIKGDVLNRVLNGNAILYDGVENTQYKLYDEEGRFLCLSRMEDGMLKVEKMFYVGEF